MKKCGLEGEGEPLCATWLASGISFCDGCARLLGYPRRVRLEIDREARRLSVEPLAEGGGFGFAPEGRTRGRVMISSAALKAELKSLFGGRPPRGGLRFPATFDGERIFVDLRREKREGE